MTKLSPIFNLTVLPKFAARPALVVDLDRAFAPEPILCNGRSVFLDAQTTHEYLADLHRVEQVDYSLGGYLEDRRNLWAGSYLPPKRSVHLGVDINVPAGTAVAAARDGHIAKVYYDPDQDGGWGSALVLSLREPVGPISHYIYAHLAKDSVNVRAGDPVNAGQVVAAIGQPHENGGWYEHLHVQALTPAAWALIKDAPDLSAIDGYDAMPEGREHPLSPDPMPLILK